jgi:CDP-paratose 2-epimerase
VPLEVEEGEMRKPDPFRSVLIFGGAGFIGSNWTHYLLEHTEAKVHVFDNLSRSGVRHNLALLQRVARRTGRLQITVGDIRDSVMVERAVRSATEIYHLAAQVAVTTSLADPRADFEINAGGTFNILEAARKSPRRPFLLFTSTNKVYGDMAQYAVTASARRYEYRDCRGISESQPLDFHSPYGCSKGAADQYVRDYARIYGLPTAVLRMSCIAGPRQFGNEDQGWVAHFLYSALSGSPVVIYGDGRQVRDVLCVHDLLQVFEAVRERATNGVAPGTRGCPAGGGLVYNVGGGPQNTISLLELIEHIKQLTGRRMQYEVGSLRPGDQLVYITDTSKLQHETGWKPRYSVPQILDEIYRWWKHNREVFAPVVQMPARVTSAALQEITETAA